MQIDIDELLRSLRRLRIDEQYLAALDTADTLADAPHLSAGDSEPAAWNDIPWLRGVRSAGFSSTSHAPSSTSTAPQ